MKNMLIAIMMLFWMPVAWADDAAQCDKLYQTNKYEQALLVCSKAAKQGDASAQFNLGWMYDNGRGVKQDYAEAVWYYLKAAEQGVARAQFNLGWMYAKGQSVQRDYAEAVQWYRKAAKQGDADAQFNLGGMYNNGRGVQQDYAEAMMWYRMAAKQYRMAAEQGDAGAQNKLGWMYENGQGVRDYNEALKWYRMAAVQGNIKAQLNFKKLNLKKLQCRSEVNANASFLMSDLLNAPGNTGGMARLEAAVRSNSVAGSKAYNDATKILQGLAGDYAKEKVDQCMYRSALH